MWTMLTSTHNKGNSYFFLYVFYNYNNELVTLTCPVKNLKPCPFMAKRNWFINPRANLKMLWFFSDLMAPVSLWHDKIEHCCNVSKALHFYNFELLMQLHKTEKKWSAEKVIWLQDIFASKMLPRVSEVKFEPLEVRKGKTNKKWPR